MKTDYRKNHQQKITLLNKAFKQLNGAQVATDKKTTNLFRYRKQQNVTRLPLADFDEVLYIDAKAKTAEVEGMVTYEKLVAATLPYGLMPAVVPQLKTITLGGAVTGMGIESGSFRYGFVHETVQSMEIFTGEGKVVEATPTNKHKDLFYSFPNSYGTFGYGLKFTIQLVPTNPYVQLRYIRHSKFEDYFAQLQTICSSQTYQDQKVDFVDGVLFERGNYVICVGTMVADAPYTSDYTYTQIFWQSILTRDEDYLTIHDYLWRWDTDWFWCSRGVKAQNPLVRRLFGQKRLNSAYYMHLFQLEGKYKVAQGLSKLLRKPARESVIQDVELPIGRAAEFGEFFLRNIAIAPVWICPARQLDPNVQWTLYPMEPAKLYVNFGFWDTVEARTDDPNYHNKLIESKVQKLQGKKSLYSDSFYDIETFSRLYNGSEYAILKSKYDPNGRLKDLYTKTVNRG